MASAERHVVAQAAFLALGPGGGEDLVLDEVEHRLASRLRAPGPPALASPLAFGSFGLGRVAPARPAPAPTSCRRSPPTSASSDQRRRQHRPLVPPRELPQPIPRRRRAGLHRLVVQVALHVRGEAVGRLVAAVAVLLQRLHHDPVQLAAHQLASASPAPCCGWRRSTAAPRSMLSRVLGLGGSSSRMIRSISSNAASCSRFLLERRRAGQQLVQQHAQRVDVAAGVDVELVASRPARGSCTRACRPSGRTR